MNPADLAKSGTEDAEQTALFSWIADWINAGGPPELKYIFAIPNGGTRGGTKQQAMMVGGRLKATGVKAGVSDIFVPFQRHGMAGLFIEMKRADGVPSDVSDKQQEFGEAMQRQGYGFVVCFGWIQAANVLKQYFDA